MPIIERKESSVSLESIGMIAMCVFNVGAICYGYGALNNRVKNLDSDFKEHKASVTELFQRMNAIEQLAARLEEAANRWERIMSNGINSTIAEIKDRLSRLEQHCIDMHAKNKP